MPQCLDSIKDLVNEIIIVDTGSTDKTVEIAESYGAKVYHHPWENDFSLHRNQSIEYSTGEWILIIDADEELLGVDNPKDFKKRLDLIPKNVSALVTTVYECDNGNKSTSWLGMRFFRRSSGIHYKNAVHNKAVFKGWAASTNIVMNHYGYSLDPVKQAAKRARTESLLKARLEEDPLDHSALYYLCQLNIGQKDYEIAYEYGMRFFECVPVGPENWQFYGVMYFYMAWISLRLNDGEKAYAWASKGLEFYPDDLDLNYVMARIGYQADRPEWLKEYGKKYFDLLPVARNRDKIETDQFLTKVDLANGFNRTIYSIDEVAEKTIIQFMREAA